MSHSPSRSHVPPSTSTTSTTVVGSRNPNRTVITTTHLLPEEIHGVGHRVLRARFHEANADAIRTGLETQARDHQIRKALFMDAKRNKFTITLHRRYPHWIVEGQHNAADPENLGKFGGDKGEAGAHARYKEMVGYAITAGWTLVFDEAIQKMSRSDEKSSRKRQFKAAERAGNALLKAAGHKSAFFRKKR